MSGGGEVRLLRQDAGQESPRMPAWKREILERRKAKGGGSGVTGSPETSPGSAGPQRVNGDLTGNVNGSSGLTRDGAAAGGSGRNYTITTASQHFGNNKELRPKACDRAPREDDRHESLVLQESLGPLEENPFIKLEKERRRRQDRQEREHPGRPVQHILELYGSVPGIRTIRADNIIIIESDPDYFPEAGDAQSGGQWQQNGVGGYSSLNDLLDRRGSAVTEIRAKEVVIYDTTISKSEENLSTLGRPEYDVPYAAGEGPGRVSRILQKFDTNYGKLQKKSHSTENLLDLDSNSSSRPRLWSKPQPDLVPKQRPGQSISSQQSSPLLQSSCSSKPKHPAPELGSPQRSSGVAHPVSSFRQRFEDAAPPRDEPDRGPNKLSRERDWEVTKVSPKPKVPCSPETRRARAESPTAPFSFKVSRPSPDFEIRPSPKPDLGQIPDGDTQARALANLRLQSRNSFTVVPKGRLTTPPAATSAIKVTPPAPTLKSTEKKAEKSLEEKEMERVLRTPKPDQSPATATSPDSPMTSDLLSPPAVVTPTPSSTPAPASPPSSPPTSPAVADSPAPSPLTSTPSPEQRSPSADQLPVTNIDDIEVEPPQRVPVPSPLVQRKKGNTFTVVPKRRVEPDAQPSSPETQQEAPSEAPPGSTPPQAPYAQLGTALKKRYPAVEDIQVIGGYLSLPKSCLFKKGSIGKKLKISFNESSLHSTYEYPSESSVWDSGDEEEEEEQEDEPPSMVGRIHIPRPSIITTPTHSNNSSDLSSYVPKHSVDFSSWQEHKHDDAVHQEDVAAQMQTTEEVMLTPADSSSLSDYSSEPALYF